MSNQKNTSKKSMAYGYLDSGQGRNQNNRKIIA